MLRKEFRRSRQAAAIGRSRSHLRRQPPAAAHRRDVRVLRRSNSVLPIAIDIGGDRVRLLQLEQPAEQAPRVIAAASFPVPGHLRRTRERNQMIAATMRQELKVRGFQGHQVVTAVPNSAIHYKSFRIPQIPPEEMRQAVLFEAKERFAFEQDDAEYRYLDAGEVRHGQEVRREIIAMGCTAETLRQHLEIFDQVGLQCVAMDAAPCAIVRSFEQSQDGAGEQSHIYADLGHQDTRIVITTEGKIIFVKSLAVGSAKMDEVLGMKMNLSVEESAALRRELCTGTPHTESHPDTGESVRDAAVDAVKPIYEQLGKEISLCLRYFAVTFRGIRPEQLTCVGGGAHDPNLCRFVSEITGVPAIAGNPLGSIETGEALEEFKVNGGLTDWATVAGLALRRHGRSPAKSTAS